MAIARSGADKLGTVGLPGVRGRPGVPLGVEPCSYLLQEDRSNPNNVPTQPRTASAPLPTKDTAGFVDEYPDARSRR